MMEDGLKSNLEKILQSWAWQFTSVKWDINKSKYTWPPSSVTGIWEEINMREKGIKRKGEGKEISRKEEKTTGKEREGEERERWGETEFRDEALLPCNWLPLLLKHSQGSVKQGRCRMCLFRKRDKCLKVCCHNHLQKLNWFTTHN